MQLKLDDTGGARELAFHRMKTAREDLEAARLNFENGQYRTSNNRAYYA
ncbi:MAG: HEPN domain-containing protein, partial [Lachnospiraceae bacterium]|nr:HEPN domain-containing protein [Lachnospiraceae bacterium]